MTLFYAGLNLRYQDYGFLPQGLNVMVSAVGFFKNGETRRDRFPRGAGGRWLDSGGFTALNRWGDYPFKLSDYLNLAAILRPQYYATLDYPCEPEISRTLSLATNQERIRATVENARRQLELESLVEAQAVPVIQGYTLGEYKDCIDQHDRAGTIRPYMAVGSMCRRLSSSQLGELIPGISEYAAQAGAARLHYFGLKLSRDLQDLREYIYSQDSAVALDAYSQPERAARDGRRFPRGRAEKEAALGSFLDRLDQLGLSWKSEKIQ